ncbi:MAG TPA: A24 family peptidase [Steroidobacteraceae bacterium]|nr:A24 family peptidase [Steroidobacteraceae bacterium]
MEAAQLLSESPALFSAIVFVLSLAIGSFLNVVIYRLPIMMDRDWRQQCAELDGQESPALPRFNLFTPRSRCPTCGKQIWAIHNIPVFSYLVLRGRCAGCRTRISVRYPIIELLTACLSAAVAWHFGFGWTALCGLAVTWFLIAMSAIDIDTQLLPDSLTLPLCWIGLVASAGLGRQDVGFALPVDPVAAIAGAAAGYLSLWSVYWLFKLLTRKEGMGYGDFKLLAALGAWMGWQMMLPIVLMSAATGAIVGIALIVFRGRDRQLPIPFGPYLAAAGWIGLMWGPEITRGYFRMAGIGHA